LCNEEIHKLFSLLYIIVIKKDEMGEVCSTHGEIRNAYKIVFGKSEGKSLFGRQRRRSIWENISMYIKGNRVGGCGLDLSGSGYGPVAGCCEHGNELLG
jgi:hypothetical protein